LFQDGLPGWNIPFKLKIKFGKTLLKIRRCDPCREHTERSPSRHHAAPHPAAVKEKKKGRVAFSILNRFLLNPDHHER